MKLQRDSDSNAAWLVGWALAAVLLTVGAGMAAINQDFAEPDNAMRLVRIRDMLLGQDWFDNVQHRLNPPDGTTMHWAQWIDAVLAAPIALLAAVVGQANAEITMAFVWPLGLLGAFMFFAVRIGGELGAADGLKRDAQWVAAIIAALAFPATEKFAPGAFDHHNVILVLVLASAWGLIRMRGKPRAGFWVGAALGVAMATAAEAVPFVVAGLLIAGLLWLLQPQTYSAGFARIGIGLSAASLISFLALVPLAGWGAQVCDAMGRAIPRSWPDCRRHCLCADSHPGGSHQHPVASPRRSFGVRRCWQHRAGDAVPAMPWRWLLCTRRGHEHALDGADIGNALARRALR